MVDSRDEGLGEGILDQPLFVKAPLVVSFYTENTPYQLEVLNLLESCQRFGIEAEIEGVASKGSWALNCAMKPFFIRDKLLKNQRPIFWVDADAVFLKKPNFYTLSDCDLSFREMKRFSHDHRFRFFSGSLFVRTTQQALLRLLKSGAPTARRRSMLLQTAFFRSDFFTCVDRSRGVCQNPAFADCLFKNF